MRIDFLGGDGGLGEGCVVSLPAGGGPQCFCDVDKGRRTEARGWVKCLGSVLTVAVAMKVVGGAIAAANVA